LYQDFGVLSSTTFSQRIVKHSLTSVELIAIWGVMGAVLYWLARVSSNRPNGFQSAPEVTSANSNGN
jgi:hypothetical protein